MVHRAYRINLDAPVIVGHGFFIFAQFLVEFASAIVVKGERFSDLDGYVVVLQRTGVVAGFVTGASACASGPFGCANHRHHACVPE